MNSSLLRALAASDIIVAETMRNRLGRPSRCAPGLHTAFELLTARWSIYMPHVELVSLAPPRQTSGGFSARVAPERH